MCVSCRGHRSGVTCLQFDSGATRLISGAKVPAHDYCITAHMTVTWSAGHGCDCVGFGGGVWPVPPEGPQGSHYWLPPSALLQRTHHLVRSFSVYLSLSLSVTHHLVRSFSVYLSLSLSLYSSSPGQVFLCVLISLSVLITWSGLSLCTCLSLSVCLTTVWRAIFEGCILVTIHG